MEKKKVQRIRMKLYKHPVKHDGTIVEFAPDGSSFKVEFDGPIPTTTFYQYSGDLVTDKLSKGSAATSGAQIWEVL